MSQSVAFKCTFNDGTRLDEPPSDFVGFRGTCSRDLIHYNITRRVWCGLSQCNHFAKAGMTGNLPEFPCSESQLFEHWRFNAGAWQRGPNEGRPISILGTSRGKIVILTTRQPHRVEMERQIIGAYEIGRIDNNQHLVATPDNRIRLTKQQSEMLAFWRYYKVKEGGADWRTGLFRYLSDNQVQSILAAMSAVCGSSEAGEKARALQRKHFGIGPAPAPSGAVTDDEAAREQAALTGKYPGGEGPEHKKLKLWIANNPEVIGLPGKSTFHLEHPFDSGDRVDVAFELPDGQWAVVEVETNFPYPGAHQAIKYRTLLAAQRRWKLATDQVITLLVAWHFDEKTKEICKKYNVQAWKCHLNKSGTRIV